MTLINNTVIDQYGRPIAAALVTIRDEDGALVDLAAGNPLITDSLGAWSCELEGGTYELVISKGDDFISRAQFVCGASNLTETRRGIANAQLGFDEIIRPTDRLQNPGWFGEMPTSRASKRTFTTCTIS